MTFTFFVIFVCQLFLKTFFCNLDEQWRVQLYSNIKDDVCLLIIFPLMAGIRNCYSLKKFLPWNDGFVNGGKGNICSWCWKTKLSYVVFPAIRASLLEICSNICWARFEKNVLINTASLFSRSYYHQIWDMINIFAFTSSCVLAYIFLGVW